MKPEIFRTYLALYVKENKNAIYWLSQANIFEHLLVHYYRTGLSRPQVQVIDEYALARIEQGLQHYFLDFGLVLMESKLLKLKVFSNLHEFVNNYTVFRDITLDSLAIAFKALLFGQLIVFLLFLCRRLWKFCLFYRRFGRSNCFL